MSAELTSKEVFMQCQTVAHYTSEQYDLHISRSYENLVLDGFVKSDETLKYLVWQVEDSGFIGAFDLVLEYGREIPRPYLLGGRCDGSIGAPVMALYLDFCTKHGLDGLALYEAAYPGEGGLEPEATFAFAKWQGVRFPHTWTEACFARLLDSLTATNQSSLRTAPAEAAEAISFPKGVVERGGYVAFKGNTRTYGPEARFTWGHVVTPTGGKVWQYDPWQSKNGVVPDHYWLAFIAVAAGRDENNQLKRQVIEEALHVSRSKTNKAHYEWWLGQLDKA